MADYGPPEWIQLLQEALETIDLDSIYPYYGYCNDLYQT